MPLSQSLFHTITRTLVIYVVVLVVIRIMGKREIGQLSSFDLVVALIIAELAAIPMEEMDIPIVQGLVPLIILTAGQVGISLLCLKYDWLRDLIYGKPTLLIKNGAILEKEMKRARYNIEDLLSQLREKNITNIDDVEFAFLENSGDLSVIPKSQKRPVTPADLGIHTQYEGFCLPLVMDGRIHEKNLKRAGMSTMDLQDKLTQQEITDISQVFFASLDTSGKLYVDRKS
ncbi:MAG: YetF domain-containing protein [Bacillota bacterium]